MDANQTKPNHRQHRYLLIDQQLVIHLATLVYIWRKIFVGWLKNHLLEELPPLNLPKITNCSISMKCSLFIFFHHFYPRENKSVLEVLSDFKIKRCIFLQTFRIFSAYLFVTYQINHSSLQCCRSGFGPGSGLFALLGSGKKPGSGFIVRKQTPVILIFSSYNIVYDTVSEKLIFNL